MIQHDIDGPATYIEDILADASIVPGAVKPSSVLKIGSFSVIVFAFDAGTNLRAHHAPVPVLLQVLDGCVVVEADGRKITLKRGGLIHLAAGLPHSVHAPEPAHLQLTVLGTGHEIVS